jgi:hypothetical protein
MSVLRLAIVVQSRTVRGARVNDWLAFAGAAKP